MSNIVEAEYTIERERTLPVIIGEIKIIEQNVAKTAMEGAIQIGQRLQEAKAKVEHGEFDQWCQENLNYSRRTAERFMRIAAEYGGENGLLSNATILSHLSISNALSLLKVPEEDREKFAEEHPVEDMTNKALEDEIRKLKEEKEDKDSEIDVLLEEKEDMASQISTMQARMTSLEQQLEKAQGDGDEAVIEDLMRKANQEAEKARKLEEKLNKAKADLKKEKDGKQAAIDQAIGNQKEAMKQEIREETEKELRQAKKSIGDLLEKVDQLEKRAENAASEKKVQFKILMDQLQDTFHKAQDCVFTEPDMETKKKMAQAMMLVTEKLSQEARF